MGLPPGNWFMNAKERKKLLRALRVQFGIEELPELVFIQNGKDKVYVITRDVERVPYEKLYVDSLGLYLGGWQADGFRLSMEGSQLLADKASLHIVLFDDELRKLWLKGEDIPWEAEGNNFVLVKHERTGDILGCGKIRQPRDGKKEETIILNYTPKARRLIVVNE